MVAGVQQVDHRGVALGLGREVGAGGGLDLAAHQGLALVGRRDAGQGGGAEIDHVAGVRAQAQVAEQVGVLVQEAGLGAQEIADGVGVDGIGQHRLGRVGHGRSNSIHTESPYACTAGESPDEARFRLTAA